MSDDLIKRLEQAQGPDRELDKAICALWVPKSFGYDIGEDWPHYTASIDAALTLVPKDGPWHLSIWSDGEVLVYKSAWAAGPQQDDEGASDDSGKTPAIALCIAALKARAAMAAKQDE